MQNILNNDTRIMLTQKILYFAFTCREKIDISEMFTIYHVQVVMFLSNPFNEHSGIVLKYHRDFS